jgi:hypothetical protein
MPPLTLSLKPVFTFNDPETPPTALPVPRDTEPVEGDASVLSSRDPEVVELALPLEILTALASAKDEKEAPPMSATPPSDRTDRAPPLEMPSTPPADTCTELVVFGPVDTPERMRMSPPLPPEPDPPVTSTDPPATPPPPLRTRSPPEIV